eukprot:1611021-Rhodomonas_salina.4
MGAVANNDDDSKLFSTGQSMAAQVHFRCFLADTESCISADRPHTEVLKLVFCQNCTILYQEVVISSKHCVSSFHINVMPATNLKKSEDLWVCLRGHSDTGSHHYLGGNWGPAGGPASKCPLLNAPSMSGDEGPGPPPWGLAVVYMDNVYLHVAGPGTDLVAAKEAIAIKLLEQVLHVEDELLHFQLVSFCIQAKFTYLARGVAQAVTLAAALKLDPASVAAIGPQTGPAHCLLDGKHCPGLAQQARGVGHDTACRHLLACLLGHRCLLSGLGG